MQFPPLKTSFALLMSALLLPAFLHSQPFYQNDEAAEWADSTLTNMTLNEKIGQLFMVAAYSNKGRQHERELKSLIEDYHIGGLIFFQGGPVRQARMTNRLQAAAKTPLMIGMDAEWDLAMRLDSVAKLPWPMTLGATNDSALAYRYGSTIGRHCKRLGVHFNFGPVLDINTNPDNPIVGVRAFGEDVERVTKMGIGYMMGMQDQGVLACGKHFPGHGDTDQDSHHTLPTVNQSYVRMSEVEWEPYRRTMEHGLASVMVAHLNVPSLDKSGTPTSLSSIVIDSLLRKELNFEGLSFTDALNMRGVSSLYPPGEVDLRALKAGNDVLLFAEDVPAAVVKIVEAIALGELTEAEIDVHVRRILMAKHGAGLSEYKPIEIAGLVADLNDRSTDVLRTQIFDNAVTVVTNQDRLLPLTVAEGETYTVINMGSRLNDNLETAVELYTDVVSLDFTGNNATDILRSAAKSDLVILGYFTDDTNPWRRFKMNDAEVQFLQRLLLQNKVIFVHFANPYGLRSAGDIDKIEAVLQAYQNTPEAAQAAAQIIFGAQEARGTLPVTIGSLLPGGHGIPTIDLHRLRYGHPEEVDMDPAFMARIDAEVQRAIEAKATPGAQVLVARRGVVVMHKSYGRPTYEARTMVQNNELYDIASITKISASLPMVMRMYDEGRLDLDDELGDFLPETVGTDKEHLKIIDILTHQAGLQPWIPFYVKTLDVGKPNEKYYRKSPEEGFTRRVAEDLYIMDSYEDTMYAAILESPLTKAGDYKYSDLGYYFMKRIVEQTYKAPLEELVDEYLYSKLGAWSMGYLPRNHFDIDMIIPTERDQYFRYQLVEGDVHDQGAAMLGGVGGHAGVFSNANDLAKLMQMYLNRGEYGGVRFFREETIRQFTRCPYCINENRRGIGFDKPQLEGAGPACDCASPNSFGHTGFTGTIAWVDPDEELVYIFLSNRVYPSAENRKLISMDIRTNIQEIIYDSLEQ
ncbi:serine hydrolase [Phaeocystidibacter luteus]|uniref:beta-N-acetylhexosaminidase n=2 Tax=Phaeocystidibacter luteus TaxID=911197 RepID=A0A6N6RG75_9FLAO|nr:serine hydrolase [Phaeocystidibacter luteus]